MCSKNMHIFVHIKRNLKSAINELIHRLIHIIHRNPQEKEWINKLEKKQMFCRDMIKKGKISKMTNFELTNKMSKKV